MKDLQKQIDEMNFSINEKDAEIIRLTMCLGDEKKKKSSDHLSCSTPSRKRRTDSKSGSELRHLADSPYFKNESSYSQLASSRH